MRLHEIKSQINEGPFDALKSVGKAVGGFAKKAVNAVVDKATDASGEGEKKQYVKQVQANYARWVNQTQPKGTNPADIDVIVKFLTTQMKFGQPQMASLYKATGIRTRATVKKQKQPVPSVAQQPEQQAQQPAQNQNPAEQPITIGGQKIMPNDPKYAQIMKSVNATESASSTKSVIAEGIILDQVKLANVWNEVIRQLYASGGIKSNPANNPINKVGGMINAMAGKHPAGSHDGHYGRHNAPPQPQGSNWKNSEDMSNLAPLAQSLGSITDLSDEEKKAAIAAVAQLRQNKK
jgi:hypothetical protein